MNDEFHISTSQQWPPIGAARNISGEICSAFCLLQQKEKLLIFEKRKKTYFEKKIAQELKKRMLQPQVKRADQSDLLAKD